MISEDKKEILLQLVNAQEDELCNIIHEVECDENVPNDSFSFIENQSNRLFRLIELLRDEIYFG
jgi:hypothetical protein